MDRILDRIDKINRIQRQGTDLGGRDMSYMKGFKRGA
jgi:hypothetical protein